MENMGWLEKIASVCIAKPLRAAGVTRGAASTLRIALGFAAALTLTMGPESFSIAAILFLAGFCLARSDATFKSEAAGTEAPGDRYAFYGDIVCNALAFVGLGIGLHIGDTGMSTVGPVSQAPIPMGMCAALALIAAPWLVKRLEVIDGRRSPEFDKIAGFDVDDIILIVPIALWVGWAPGLLLVVAFGGAAFAGGLYMAHFRKFHSMQ